MQRFYRIILILSLTLFCYDTSFSQFNGSQGLTRRWRVMVSMQSSFTYNYGRSTSYVRDEALVLNQNLGADAFYTNKIGIGLGFGFRAEYAFWRSNFVGFGSGMKNVESRERVQEFNYSNQPFGDYWIWDVSDRMNYWSNKVYWGNNRKWFTIIVGLEMNTFLWGKTNVDLRYAVPGGTEQEQPYEADLVAGIPELIIDRNDPFAYSGIVNYEELAEINQGVTNLQINAFLEFRFYPIPRNNRYWVSLAYYQPLNPFKEFNNPFYSLTRDFDFQTHQELYYTSYMSAVELGIGWNFITQNRLRHDLEP